MHKDKSSLTEFCYSSRFNPKSTALNGLTEEALLQIKQRLMDVRLKLGPFLEERLPVRLAACHKMVMVVSSNNTSTYAKSAYLSTHFNSCAGKESGVSGGWTPIPSYNVEKHDANAKGKDFIIQGQSTGEAGIASAVSSSCRETIWMLLCCLIWVPASRAFSAQVLKFFVALNQTIISLMQDKNISLYLPNP